MAMDILGPLPQANNKNVFFIVMTDRYSQMTEAIPTSETLARHVANVFVGHWIVSYGIPGHLLMENDPSFVSMFFSTLCMFRGLDHLATTT